MRLSVVIPAHNEAGSIQSTVDALTKALKAEKIVYEIVVVNDNSSDGTEAKIRALHSKDPQIVLINNLPPNGFGLAIQAGIRAATGDAVAIYMADASDSPADLVRFFCTMQEKDVDCVFGTRFHRDSQVIDYPWLKLVLNRLANLFIKVIFGIGYNDTTNAFKLYRRSVLEGLRPYLSHHFNLTVELPLKAIVRGYSYAVVPNSWHNRKSGVSKLKIKEMGSRYLFIIIYCLIERWLSRGDYKK